jgi:hypothetical protein
MSSDLRCAQDITNAAETPASNEQVLEGLLKARLTRHGTLQSCRCHRMGAQTLQAQMIIQNTDVVVRTARLDEVGWMIGNTSVKGHVFEVALLQEANGCLTSEERCRQDMVHGK